MVKKDKETKQVNSEAVLEIKEIKIQEKKEDEISVFEKIDIPTGGTFKEKVKEYCNNLKVLCPNKVYVFSLAAVCIFNFISFSIQFWVSDHLLNVMKFDQDTITVVFIITCVTAPISGVILGGVIVGKLGGYVNKKAVLFCLIASLFAGIDSIFIVIQESILGFGVVLWIFLFFESFL